MIDRDRAKAWIKKESADEDDLIDGLVAAAAATIEAQTGKFMSPKSFTQRLAGFPCRYPYTVRFSRGPVTDVTTIEYDPAGGGEPVTVTDFRLVEGFGASFNGTLQPAYSEVWSPTLDGPGTVRVTFTAGYADGEAPELDQAALMLVAHWYRNREAVSVGPSSAAVELPLAVAALISPYRPVGLA